MKRKRNYFHLILWLMFFCYSVNETAQSSSISYELIYKPNPVQKDKIKKQQYKLDILHGKSIFRTETRRESDSLIKKYEIDPKQQEKEASFLGLNDTVKNLGFRNLITVQEFKT
ncbi:hypothetical protein QGN23_01290 [Chryseobacterium gotjawalense]|uniref:GLPGLI family protein n=1 Tax=Chryseobacterium gotjawalense TaxID=3042315 RepID=A0ABY8RD74_9FLAO|nr:hypothetical protein [Chryseobacterium sp. wdc7]WHF51926.1 hypothetical protein QGN23_01290 [Chryseobacterium sp. wdc7]